MDSFPAFFPLAGRRVAIAGDDPAVEAKLRLFESSPAQIVRLRGAQAADPAAYAGAVLAFVVGDEAFCAAAAGAARAAHVPVNVTDRPRLCDFTTPSIIDRGEVVAAIGTGGASPMLATLLRHDIEARVPQGAGRVAALFRTLQDEVRAALPDLAARRAFLRDALAGPAAQAAQAGDMETAARLLRAALASPEKQRGLIQVVDGRGPADLLTLRAAQVLASADILVVDPDASAEVLALARRDAERLASAEVDVERLAGLAARGLRVARLVTTAGWRAELEALQGLGVEAETTPIAGY